MFLHRHICMDKLLKSICTCYAKKKVRFKRYMQAILFWCKKKV